jgi:phospholipid/cholesterol/gamma-HCH transport system substrate-binding protein
MSTPVTPATGSRSARIRYRLYGLAFLLIIALLAAMLLAVYNKTFTPYVHVTLHSDRAGLQLLPTSDVKVRGLIVGEVRRIRATAGGAAIDLAIQPDKAPLIPRNVSARMLPKTVFGEKFVELVLPAQGRRERQIRSGDQIAQDRSTTAVELEKILNGLMPLLRAVKPERLNSTLNALAMALQGRGARIGRQIDEADALLRQINRQLPAVVENIKGIGDVATVYDAAAPDLLRLLRNLMTTNTTIVAKRETIGAVIERGITVADQSRRFVADNENRIVGFGVANREALATIAHYSPSIPCVLEGLVKLKPRLEDAVGGGQPGVHVTAEIVKPRPGYKPGLDDPQYRDFRRPRCYGLPDHPKVPFPNHQVLDGTQDDRWWGPALGRAASSGMLVDPQAGSVAADNELIKGLVAPVMRTPADQVPDIATLLVGPVAHGSVVVIE